ncbi:MAG: glycosyltransferase, partial [Duncaniella sp.]|nr:glycosyltransferase [Duncaniella sp.]
LDDPIKGLDIAIEALNHIFDTHPAAAQNSALYLVGAIRNPSVLSRLRFSYRHLGLIRDEKVMRMMYSMAKVVLSTSLYETLGATLVEGQAAGAIPVTFGGDGREDVVTHLETGYIAEGRDPKSIAEGILWALNSDIDRDFLHETALHNFGARGCTDRYIELFSSIV